jgi:hypothetical protein
MKQVLLKLLSLALAVVCVAEAAFAQDPPPVSAGPVSVTKIVPQPSLAALSPKERFVSADGTFSIALPRSITGYSAQTPKMTGGSATGGSYSWQLREGIFVVNYYNYNQLDLATEKDISEYFDGLKQSFFTQIKATVESERPLKLGNMRGYEYLFRLPSGQTGIMHVLAAGKQSYNMVALLSPNVPTAETLAIKVFESFELIDRAEIDADIQRKLEEATPAPLPQNPVVPKERSDAEDINLFGQVKTVTEEHENLSETSSGNGRQLASVTEYNEAGNRLKDVHYTSNARPSVINVYGYIDGARVMNSGSISYESDPPPPARAVSAMRNPADTRYRLKYQFTYKDGKLAEMQLVQNDGTPATKIVYKYRGDEVEKVFFDEDGSINQRYVYKLDEKGNHIEEFAAALSKNDSDKRYIIRYESFDDHGNWTKATTLQVFTQDGKEILKPAYNTYRNITYYK